MNDDKELNSNYVRSYYNDIYYADINNSENIPPHFKKLARKLQLNKQTKLLDVACGTAEWLSAASQKGAIPTGIDISDKAIQLCEEKLPNGSFYQGGAESLPFEDSSFNFISCLGALEHFLHPDKALDEMYRVGTANAQYLILIPNTDFLTAKLGFYKGTDQTDIKEELRTLHEWEALFNEAGLSVLMKWKDLHVLSWSWIRQGSVLSIPLRTLQALLLSVWPLKWQYQVYFLCGKK